MKPLISACLALTLFACATSPTGRSQLTLFPESQMAQMGASTFTSMQQSQKMDTNPSNARYVTVLLMP